MTMPTLHPLEHAVFLESFDLAIRHLGVITTMCGELARTVPNEAKAIETYEIAQEALGWLMQQRAHLAQIETIRQAQQAVEMLATSARAALH